MSNLDMDKQRKIVLNKVEYIVAPEQNVNGYFVLFDTNGEKVFLEKRTAKLRKVIPPKSPDFPPPPLPLPLSQDKQQKEDKQKEDNQKEENILEAPEKTSLMEKDIDDEEELARHEQELETKNASQKNSSSFLLQKMIKEYFEAKPSNEKGSLNDELEVRFNTAQLHGNKKIQQLTKQDYDNVIKYLKSVGFTTENDAGEYSLRMQNEFRDRNTGIYKQSNIRTEIYGLEAIQYYCQNDMRPDVLEKIATQYKDSLKYTKKNFKMVNNERLYPVNFDDFQ
jgi:hypothetical protein